MKNIRNLILLVGALFIIVVFSNCGGGHSDPPPPCGPATICIDIYKGNNICYTKPPFSYSYFNWLARNNNHTKAVTAYFFKEYLVETDWRQLGNGFMRKIGPDGVIDLGCSYENIPGLGKYYEIRYRRGNACFDNNDSSCNIVLPNNIDLPKITCDPNTVENACSSCIVFDYNTLIDTIQQKTIIELYKSLLYSNYGDTYTFKNDFAKLFSILVTDSLCYNRQTKIENYKFESFGSACQIKPLISPAIELIGASDSYSKMWVTIPNLIQGNISNNYSISTLNLNREFGLSIDISVELEKSKTIRKDILSNIVAYKKERALTLSGDFICIKLFNLPVINGNKKKNG